METNQILAVAAGLVSGVALIPGYELGSAVAARFGVRGDGDAAGFVRAVAGILGMGVAFLLPVVLFGVYPLRDLAPYFAWSWLGGLVGVVVVLGVRAVFRELLGRRQGDV